MEDANGRKVFTLEEVLEVNPTQYVTVEYGEGLLRLGSQSSLGILEWLESNDNEATKKDSGLRLLVASLVGPNGERVPKEQFDLYMNRFKTKDAKANGLAVAAALELNGISHVIKRLTDAKNV